MREPRLSILTPDKHDQHSRESALFFCFLLFFFNLFNDKVHCHGQCYRKCIDIFLYLFRHRFLIVRVYVIGGDIPSTQVTCKGFHTVDFGGDSEVVAFKVLVSFPVYSSLLACQNKLVKNTFVKSWTVSFKMLFESCMPVVRDPGMFSNTMLILFLLISRSLLYFNRFRPSSDLVVINIF